MSIVLRTDSSTLSETLAWHYTTGTCFMQIVDSGLLLPTAVFVAPPERPVLWFSTNQQFELTACKGVVRADGSRRTVSVEEMRDRGRGLVRFGLRPELLLAGAELREQARIPPRMWQALVHVSRIQGANPDQWLGTLQSVPVQDLVVDVIDNEDHLVRVYSQGISSTGLDRGDR